MDSDDDDIAYFCCKKCKGLFVSKESLKAHKVTCTGNPRDSVCDLVAQVNSGDSISDARVTKTLKVPKNESKSQAPASVCEVNSSAEQSTQEKPLAKSRSNKSKKIEKTKTKKKSHSGRTKSIKICAVFSKRPSTTPKPNVNEASHSSASEDTSRDVAVTERSKRKKKAPNRFKDFESALEGYDNDPFQDPAMKMKQGPTISSFCSAIDLHPVTTKLLKEPVHLDRNQTSDVPVTRNDVEVTSTRKRKAPKKLDDDFVYLDSKMLKVSTTQSGDLMDDDTVNTSDGQEMPLSVDSSSSKASSGSKKRKSTPKQCKEFLQINNLNPIVGTVQKSPTSIMGSCSKTKVSVTSKQVLSSDGKFLKVPILVLDRVKADSPVTVKDCSEKDKIEDTAFDMDVNDEEADESEPNDNADDDGDADWIPEEEHIDGQPFVSSEAMDEAIDSVIKESYEHYMRSIGLVMNERGVLVIDESISAKENIENKSNDVNEVKKKRGRPKKVVIVKSPEEEENADLFAQYGEAHPDVPSTTMLVCNHRLCRYKSMYPGHFKRHLKSHCEIRCGFDGCDYTTPYQRKMNLHRNTHTKPFVCDTCDFKAGSRKTLNQHMMIHNNVKPFKCPVEGCDYAARQNKCLKEHMTKHTGEKLRCDQCAFSTHYKAALSNHMLKHDGDAFYMCSVCGYQTSDRGTFKKHMKRHNKNLNFKCPKCNYRSVSKTTIKHHYVTVHEKRKLFQCDQCTFQTSYRSALKLHLMSHKGIRPFLCPQCEYSSIMKGKVLRHIKTTHRDTNVRHVYQLENQDFTIDDISKYKTQPLNLKDLDIVEELDNVGEPEQFLPRRDRKSASTYQTLEEDIDVSSMLDENKEDETTEVVMTATVDETTGMYTCNKCETVCESFQAFTNHVGDCPSLAAEEDLREAHNKLNSLSTLSPSKGTSDILVYKKGTK